MANLTRPSQQQRMYGNMPAPFVPGGGNSVGATMVPPMPSAPRTTGRAATGGAMPYVPPPVVTNPNITPFQLSLNNQRADEATKAKDFASAAPLPMSGGSYSGAYGEGPGAQRQAEAARSNFIGHNESIIDRQDLGPGIGVRSFSNKVDADYAAAHPYVSPLDQEKINSQKAWQASQGVWQKDIAPSIGKHNDAQTGKVKLETEQSKQMMPGKLQLQDAQIYRTGQQADAIPQNAATAQEKVKQTGADAQAKRDDAAKNEASKPALLKMRGFQTQMAILEREIANPNLSAEQKADANNRLTDYQRRHDAAMVEYSKARGLAAPSPTAKPVSGQGQQPGASAAPAGGQQVGEHVNPATGQRANWDGSKWVIT